MCAIAGFMAIGRGRGDLPSPGVLDRMTDALAHRGPDSRGTWYDETRGVGLGHRRLAIRDLSPTGAQPMTSSCGRFVMVYNGEVYSHDEIAQDLQGTSRKLRGTSDTEIMLEAFAQWGVGAVLPRLIGMFAFALFDRETGELTLGRDRLGIKPLYWRLDSGLLLFASELKSLRQVPGWVPKVDRNALGAFMRHNYIPAPHTIYEGVQKLEPGTVLRVAADGTYALEKYWDLRGIAEAAIGNRAAHSTAASDRDNLAELDALLSDAVARRMVSDVPLGALLSGGVDSSLVSALMTQNASRPVKTFSIGFAERGFDEAPYAAKIAGHLQTDHTELYVEPGHALDLIDKLPHWYDEPFADSSQIPTLLVCELTRQHVTVVLSGDGGDELFAGYSRYHQSLNLQRKLNTGPAALRRLLAQAVLSQQPARFDAMGRLLPAKYRRNQLGDRLHKFAQSVVRDKPDDLYLGMISLWQDPDETVIGGSEAKGILWDQNLSGRLPDLLDRMQLVDTLTYLPDDILTKVDRASMSVALEARVPLLDHRVVEKAWALPQDMKRREGTAKWALRELLYRRVPRNLIDRPKMGFGVPIADWLRGPLRDWAEHLLDEQRLSSQGLLIVAPIRERWKAHLQGDDWAYPLWTVLMLQAWIDANEGITL